MPRPGAVVCLLAGASRMTPLVFFARLGLESWCQWIDLHEGKFTGKTHIYKQWKYGNIMEYINGIYIYIYQWNIYIYQWNIYIYISIGIWECMNISMDSPEY